MHENMPKTSSPPFQKHAISNLSPAASAIFLKHCKEFLDYHEIRKYPTFYHKPFLSSKDVKLLRHIIESNEKYHCLKEKDTSHLKQILAAHMSAVESHRKFLRKILSTLKDKRDNDGLIKEPINDIAIRDNNLGWYTDGIFQQNQANLDDTQLSEIKNYPEKFLPINNNQTIKSLYYEEYYVVQIGFIQTIPESLDISMIQNSYTVADIRSQYLKRRQENHKNARSLLNESLKIALNSKRSKDKNITNEDKIIPAFKSNYVPTADNSAQKIKNWIVFLVNLILCSILVLSFTVIKFDCVNDF